MGIVVSIIVSTDQPGVRTITSPQGTAVNGSEQPAFFPFTDIIVIDTGGGISDPVDGSIAAGKQGVAPPVRQHRKCVLSAPSEAVRPLHAP